MSWSASAIGKPKAVAENIEKQCTAYKCPEPEETIRQGAAGLVRTALEAFPEGMAVKVDMSGSQSTGSDPTKATNTLSVKIEPIYGFVE